MPAGRHSRVDIRRTHPGLYHGLMTYGCVQVAAGFNLWYSDPTFNPYDIPKNLIGTIFFALGAGLLVFLNVHRDLRKVRLVLAVAIGFAFFWGISNTQQFFAGKASLQLPIWIVGMSIAQIPWLIESPRNPMTEREK